MKNCTKKTALKDSFYSCGNFFPININRHQKYNRG